MSSNFNVNSLAVYLPYSAEVGIGTSNVVNTGSGNITIGNSLSYLGSSNGSVTLTAPTSTAPYTLKLPALATGASNLPYTQNSLTISQTGQASFAPAEFTSVQYSSDGTTAPSLVTSSFLYSAWQNTNNNGQAVFSLTNSGGTALFNTIVSVSALCFNSGTQISSVTLCGGYSISSDKKTLTITAVQSANILLGGSALSLAKNVNMSVTVIGY